MQTALPASMAHLRAPAMHPVKPDHDCCKRLAIPLSAETHRLQPIVARKAAEDALEHSHINRRLLFSATAATAAAALAQLAPAQASVTLTLKGKSPLQLYTLKSGYSITVPGDMALAYDRSGANEYGTQVFFANLRSFTTISIFKLPLPADLGDGVSPSPAQLLDSVLAEQRNNQSTFDFELLSGPEPTPRDVLEQDESPAALAINSSSSSINTPKQTYYDSEYVLSICRGLIQEGSGGRRRCVGPNDMDLQVVSRRFYQTLAVQDNFMYVARGSTTIDQWQSIGPVAVEAVQSFRLPASAVVATTA